MDFTTGTKTGTPEMDTPQAIAVIPRQLIDVRDVQNLNVALGPTAGVCKAGLTRQPMLSRSLLEWMTPVPQVDPLAAPYTRHVYSSLYKVNMNTRLIAEA